MYCILMLGVHLFAKYQTDTKNCIFNRIHWIDQVYIYIYIYIYVNISNLVS